MPDFYSISAVLFDPDNPQIVMAAQGRGNGLRGGVWRSVDGGLNWDQTNVADGVWSDMEVGIRDGSGRRHTYVVGQFRAGAIWRSDDQGGSWRELINPRGSAIQQGEIPVAAEVATSRRNANRVYLVLGPDSTHGFNDWGAFVSDDAGANWRDISNGLSLGGQDLYNLALAAGGTTEDVVYACGQGSAQAYRPSVGTWSLPIDMGHADCHGIAVSPTDPNFVIFANDGGVYDQTYNPNAKTWGTAHSENAKLGLTQFYSFATHPGDLNQMLGGTQDNGTISALGKLSSWNITIDHTDSGFSLFHPTSPSTVYGTSHGEFYRSINGGASFSFIGTPAPHSEIGAFALDPSDPNRLYTVTDQLYRFNQTTTGWDQIGTGRVVTATAPHNPPWVGNVVVVAKSDPNVIYVGANDGSVTMITGARGSNPQFTRISDSLPDNGIRPIISISVNPTNAFDLLIGGDMSGDCESFICGAGGLWRCPDTRSPTWTEVDGIFRGGLPSFQLASIVRDPDEPVNTWYVATGVGVFQTTDGGGTWMNATQPLGLPNVAVHSLEVNATTRYLTAGTFGRGAWRIRLPGGKLPDLIVTGSGMSPAAPRAGNLITFSGTIKNQGSTSSPGNVVHSLTFSVDGSVKSSSTNNSSSLGAGGSRTLAASTTWKATAGTHTLLLRADDANRISESNDGNNTRSVTFTVAR